MNKEEAKVRIDSIINHLEWRHGGGTHYVESDRDQAHQIIDQIELIHPKIKLPREAVEELDQFAARCADVLQFAYHLYALSATEFPALVNLMCSAEGRWAVIDAYRYGWEAEPEAKWYVKAPESWHICEDCWANIEYGEINFSEKYWATPFTRAELNKYHFDSDIFTLVPVGDEK